LGTENREAADRALIDWKSHQRRVVRSFVSQIAQGYLKDKEDKASRKTMGWSWKQVSPFFGHLRPDQITRELCRDYAKKRVKQGMSQSTIVRELSFLRSALKWSDKNTPALVEVPSAPLPRIYHLTRQEWKDFIGVCTTPHIRLFAVLAYTTAARSAAILELTWDRVDFARRIVDFGHGETRYKGRSVVKMNSRCEEALRAAKDGALTDRVIEWAGVPVKSVKRGFSEAAKRAKLPDLTPHVLRHTAAVHMAESGRPMAEIAQYLGHSGTAVTERVYARFSPDFLEKAARTLDW
jgi:integrase